MTPLLLLAVLLLVAVNAFFVAAEYGLVTARRTRIVELQHQGNRRARDVLRITSDPGRFIAAMQLGVTLTSIGIGALGDDDLDAFVEEIPVEETRHYVKRVLQSFNIYQLLYTRAPKATLPQASRPKG